MAAIDVSIEFVPGPALGMGSRVYSRKLSPPQAPHRGQRHTLAFVRWVAALFVLATLAFAREVQAQFAGGEDATGALSSAELFDPSTPAWSPTGSLANARFFHTATLLTNGQVLVAGGLGPSGAGYLSSAELYNPSTCAWSLTGPLVWPRYLYTATLLPNGQVLAAGGDGVFLYQVTSELYTPAPTAVPAILPGDQL